MRKSGMILAQLAVKKGISDKITASKAEMNVNSSVRGCKKGYYDQNYSP